MTWSRVGCPPCNRLLYELYCFASFLGFRDNMTPFCQCVQTTKPVSQAAKDWLINITQYYTKTIVVYRYYEYVTIYIFKYQNALASHLTFPFLRLEWLKQIFKISKYSFIPFSPPNITAYNSLQVFNMFRNLYPNPGYVDFQE